LEWTHKYEELSIQFWERKKYVLYFICIYNLKSIGYFATINRGNYENEKIKNKIKDINLLDVLLRCPINGKVSKIFADLISYSYFLKAVKDLNELMINLYDDKKRSENGGFSINSN
jgi:hypothetical protein